MPRHFAICDDHIQLDRLLKATGQAKSGGTAHAAISDGLVSVEGEIEIRQRAKLRPGQRLEFAGEVAEWVALAAG
ncbi:MAG: RNA-binding S4 domain-containing protein [Rhodocyclaceae bacterium]